MIFEQVEQILKYEFDIPLTALIIDVILPAARHKEEFKQSFWKYMQDKEYCPKDDINFISGKEKVRYIVINKEVK